VLAACGGGAGRPDLSLLDDGVLRVGLLQECPSPAPELPGDLVRGCLDGEPRHAVEEARRLVEGERVDVILAYPGDDEGYALALYVRTQPDKTLVLGSSALQATTLDVRAPNVFRYVPDAAQRAAGLGTYAYDELGWRVARIERQETQFALEQAHAFAAEFCRLGGRLVGFRDPADGTFVSIRGLPSLDGRVVASAEELDAVARLRYALRRVTDLSDGHAALRAELGRGLDENGQAIVDVRLLDGGTTVRLVDGVEQTFGGAFGPETSPPEGDPGCD
jgi:hypothetical protein